MTSLAATAGSLRDDRSRVRSRDPDAELVRAFLEGGDPEVFSRLIRPYERPVFRLAVSVLGPGHEAAAEDLTQEIFVHVYHKLSTFRFASKFSTWLYRVAYRKAIDERRKARYRRPHVSETVLETMPAERATPLEEALQAERRTAVRRAVANLSEPHRTAVLLFYWLGRPVDEIATLLDARPATIRSYLFRARARLRDGLETSP